MKWYHKFLNDFNFPVLLYTYSLRIQIGVNVKIGQENKCEMNTVTLTPHDGL